MTSASKTIRNKTKHTIWLSIGSWEKLGEYYGQRRRSIVVRAVIDKIVARLDEGLGEEMLEQLDIKIKDIEL